MLESCFFPHVNYYTSSCLTSAAYNLAYQTYDSKAPEDFLWPSSHSPITQRCSHVKQPNTIPQAQGPLRRELPHKRRMRGQRPPFAPTPPSCSIQSRSSVVRSAPGIGRERDRAGPVRTGRTGDLSVTCGRPATPPHRAPGGAGEGAGPGAAAPALWAFSGSSCRRCCRRLRRHRRYRRVWV